MYISVELRNSEANSAKDIDLPTTYSTIEDAISRIGSDGIVNIRGNIIDEYGRNIIDINYEKCNIFELNYLAEKLESLDYLDCGKFIGACKITKCTDLFSAINIIENIQNNSTIDIQPAQNEQELAEFYLENNLITELENIRDEQYQWIIDHTDYLSLGEEIAEREGGVFIGDGYVTASNLESLYDGSFRMPVQEKYSFKMEIGERLENDSGARITVVLPVEDTELSQLKADFEVDDFSELTCYKFESVVPILEHMDFDMSDIVYLNELAQSIQDFKQNDQFKIYKAMIDELVIIDLETVMDLCEHVSAFELQENARDFADYGRSKFKNMLPDELLECLDTGNYGRKIAEKNGVSMTSYGALIPKDGINLLERLTKIEPAQGFEMSMN